MYTHLTLFGLWILGIIIHNLIKLDGLKKATKDGNVNYALYFKMEWISILISTVIGIGALWTSQEIKELANVGKMLGLAFIFGGYTAQSLFITFMGKAQKILDQKTN